MAHKSTILIVDDESSARDTLEALLFREGYDLAFACNGAEALAKAAELTPDLILLDVMMPDMDGFEVCQRLRTDPLLAEVPVIMVTALDDRDSRLQGIKAGADDFVSKPFDFGELQLRVRTIVQINRYRRLLEERSRFEQLVKLSPDGLTIVDAEGVIRLANPAMLQMLGADEEDDVVEKEISAFIAADQADHFSTYLHDAITEMSQVKQIESWFVRLNGDRFPVDISAGPFVWHEEPAAQITVRDITQRKRMNAQLYQAVCQIDRLRVLNELDQALAATLDQEKMAEVTLQQITAALDAPIGTMFILPSQANTHPERMFTQGTRGFTLERGWIEVAASEQDVQRLQTLLQLLKDSREAISFSADDLASLNGQRGLAEQWGPHGLAVPIWGDENLIAVLALGGWPANRPLTDEDRALAQAAASRAGQAIQNARLYQASQQQSARLSTLHAISTAAVSSLELDTVLRQVLELTCQALNADAGAILVSDPDTGGLTFVLTLTDERSDLRGHRLAPGEGIAGWVAQHGQSVRVSDVRHDPRWYNGVDTTIGFETRSLLCVPLKHKRHEKITGVIEILNQREGTFSDDDLSLLEAAASIAAAALENARLYMTTRARAAELALLNEVGLALTSTLDFSMLVHAALSQIQRLFQADLVSLLQPDPQTDELCFVKTLAGRTPVEISLRLPPGEGIVGWALEQRQPTLVDDAQADPRSPGWVYQHTGIQARGLMVVPLLARGHDIGVVEVISSEPGAYTSNELRTLQAIASTLAIALENAGLYDEMKTLLREREQAQAQLIHAEKMTALGRLVASIAHEINNPLQAVQTYLALAQEELEPDLGPDNDQRREKMSRYLDTVGGEIERVATIVRRMRDFCRPAREGLQPTYLHAILESVLELTNKQLQHSNVTVERAWADYLPEIQANPDHLKQVFLNLVLNGIDAMPEGGTLHISTALDQIQTHALPPTSGGAPAVRIEFSDTGKGIPPGVLARLFEPFYTTKERGTGLGLSISYGIIQSHHGQITVESHVGLGTTFAILLPVEQPFDG